MESGTFLDVEDLEAQRVFSLEYCYEPCQSTREPKGKAYVSCT